MHGWSSARLGSAPRILLGVQARLEGRANGSHKALENVTSALEIYRPREMMAVYKIPVVGISAETGAIDSDSFEHK